MQMITEKQREITTELEQVEEAIMNKKLRMWSGIDEFSQKL